MQMSLLLKNNFPNVGSWLSDTYEALSQIKCLKKKKQQEEIVKLPHLLCRFFFNLPTTYANYITSHPLDTKQSDLSHLSPQVTESSAESNRKYLQKLKSLASHMET
ncbi:Mediator Of Rna polymerase Ii Transcription Subunit 13 [Manis pentadactyla]|nr:Mediator Of Rna polymerase Ii Transcription Subunit 13 [Manis pentadactyla]